jgi:hypothetical protein
MFPQKQSEQKVEARRKEFLVVDKKTMWVWWQEEISYLFHPAAQITEVKLIPVTDGSFNVFARVDLKDRFEYKLIDNKKTLAAAKKLAEDFAKMLQAKPILSETTDNPSSVSKTNEGTEKTELNGLEALIQLKGDLKI